MLFALTLTAQPQLHPIIGESGFVNTLRQLFPVSSLYSFLTAAAPREKPFF